MPRRTGAQCKLYYCATLLSATNPPESATWVEIKGVRDLTKPLEKDTVELPARGDTYVQQITSPLIKSGIEFEMYWDEGNAGLQVLKDKFLDNSLIALAAMSGDITVTGVEGLVGNFQITSFPTSEPLQDGVSVSIKAVPADDQTDWYEVT